MIHSAYPEEGARSTNGYLDKDLRPQERRDGEFDFFISQAKRSGGPVLELASGAGRILMVLAEAGFEVFGVEASWPMLAIGKKAVARLPEGTKKKIHLIQGDMRRFAFIRKFPLIIIPFTSFWFNFHADAFRQGGSCGERMENGFKQATSCIASITATLEGGGTFIVDSPDVGQEELSRWWAEMARKFGFEYSIVKPYVAGVKVLIARKK